MSNIPTCPVLKAECIRERCSWWMKEGACWIPILAICNAKLVVEIRKMRKEIKHELADNQVDIYNELLDIEEKLGN